MTIGKMRRALLLTLVVGAIGTSAELALLEHYETWRQWLPFVLLGALPPAALTVHLRPSRTSALLMRVLAAALAATAVLGVYFHVEANREFEAELDPAIGGTALLVESLGGALPALAPGAMLLLGLLGWVSVMGLVEHGDKEIR